MTVKTLYKFVRANGGVTVSTVAPDGNYTTTNRLIADDGKLLKKGDVETPVIDTNDANGWVEIDAPDINSDDVSGWTEIDAPDINSDDVTG